MKFIHIADVHLGASPDAGSAYSKSRTQEIWNSFAGVIEACRENETDVLLIAGDLFHRQPLLRELKEVNFLFSGIPHTEVFIIAGNHDYLKKDSYYRTFSWAENVHMIRSEQITCVEVPRLDLAVYGLSYVQKENTERAYDRAVPFGKQKYEILLGHGGDDKHIPFRAGDIAKLGYDYAAFGHIHKPQQLIPDRAYYSGALEPTDKNDTGAHGYISGELTESGCTASFVPCAAREYIHMDIPVTENMTGYGVRGAIRSAVEDKGVQNIYKIILTGQRDPEILFDLTNMDSYGNIIEIADNTRPAYDFERLYEQNKGNLLGKFIQNLNTGDKESIEYCALCEGVQALMETRRGFK
ncbi:metallophosphoesterase family protein [[Clostridium] hylemonae]|uniref:metallophosphoesterase family protein n=1 Tax=[Clostridium] hylemonae TaxID=89153 RepID=UPI001105849E|nr:DNA repair exonuclease [[Clostridium] hylemonae]